MNGLMIYRGMVIRSFRRRTGSVLVWMQCFCQALRGWKQGEKAIDLGTGTGIIPILLEAKYEGEHYTGLEIQDEMADMAARSVALNHLEEKVSIVKGDIKEASRLFGAASFDVVTSNPPYMNDAHGLKNPDLPKVISGMKCSVHWMM